MTSIAGRFLQNAMQRSLLGAHAQDPVVPDRSARRAPGPERSTLGAHPADATLRVRRYGDRHATQRRAVSPR
jgi:hypothetical protein